MELIIFIGVQATGKSTFYKQNFADTHVRVNGDMLRTKHREKLLIEACLNGKINFVVDKVNATAAERAELIKAARTHQFSVIGYYFRSNFAEALKRNSTREGKARVPDAAVGGTMKRLEIPQLSEGFEKLFYVWINDQNEFVIENWNDEI